MSIFWTSPETVSTSSKSSSSSSEPSTYRRIRRDSSVGWTPSAMPSRTIRFASEAASSTCPRSRVRQFSAAPTASYWPIRVTGEERTPPNSDRSMSFDSAICSAVSPHTPSTRSKEAVRFCSVDRRRTSNIPSA